MDRNQPHIVDPETGEELPDGHVGEVLIGGPHVTQGYRGRPEETKATFTSESGVPQIRCGDLGFVDGGELFITGRKKDVIVVRGENYYPQDIDLELCAGTYHKALRPGCCAAFGIESELEEKVVLIQEVRERFNPKDGPAVLAAIRTSVTEAHELLVEDVVLVTPRTLLKTTSGKIQRQLCRRHWTSSKFDSKIVCREQQPSNARENNAIRKNKSSEAIAAATVFLKDHFNSNDVHVELNAPLRELGLDSIALLQFLNHVEDEAGLTIPDDALPWQRQSKIFRPS